MKSRPPARRRMLAIAQCSALACALLAGSAMAQKPHQGVLDAATQSKDGALKMLETMVNIDSGSADTAGLAKVSDLAVEELRKLGARIETFPAEPHPAPTWWPR